VESFLKMKNTKTTFIVINLNIGLNTIIYRYLLEKKMKYVILNIVFVPISCIIKVPHSITMFSILIDCLWMSNICINEVYNLLYTYINYILNQICTIHFIDFLNSQLMVLLDRSKSL